MGDIAFVFPGQGSQKVSMGLDLYQDSPAAREVFEECDRALDFPLSQLCFQGPEEELCQTIHAQPAIMATSIACLRAASELHSGFRPSLVAGHSLGEYSALVAAGVLEFGDCIRLVRERGRLMHQAGAGQPGGMAAIIGLDEPSLVQLCQEAGVEIANINSPNQIVISGAVEALNQAMELARSQRARVVPLEVSGAFHSQLMKSAADELARIISELHFRDPEIPIVVNTTAQPATTAQEIKEELANQLLHCVRWRHSVQYMIDRGVSTFIEIGPGSVLSGLIKRIDKGAQTVNVSDMSSIRELSFWIGDGLMIESYRFGSIVIDGKEYSDDVLILRQGVKSWWRRQGHELCPEDLDEVISERPQALIVGTGAYGLVQIPAETRQYLESQGIELVVAATDKACDSYNQLCRSQRVAAALHLTC